MKGYIGYVHHGFKGVAKMYDTVNWGNGIKPKSIIVTPFKKTYIF